MSMRLETALLSSENAGPIEPCLLEALKEELGIPLTSKEEDLKLLLAIRAVARAAAGEHGMRREFWRTRYTEILPGPGKAFLYPSRWPIESVESVEVDGVGIEDFAISGARRDCLYRKCGWGKRDIKLNLVTGWLMPGEVIQWSPGAEVALGQFIRPSSSAHSSRFEATSAGGPTGDTEPEWAGEVVLDGGVEWSARAAVEQPEDLAVAAVLVAAEWYRGGGFDLPAGVVSESDSESRFVYSQVVQSPVPPMAEALWRSYR